MDKFDEKVIGYESTKEILRQILDILKRPEVYKRKGVSIPRGMLMESDPGLGKSLLASILMEESERKPFVFRKTSQENSFLDELRAVFAMAKEAAMGEMKPNTRIPTIKCAEYCWAATSV